MREISSYKIKLNGKLRTEDIMKIYQYSLKKDMNIYLYHKESMANARNLPNLLSFFFVCNHDEILLIIEGKEASKTYQQLNHLLASAQIQTA